MDTITRTAIRAYVFGTESGSQVTIALVDETWVVTYVGRLGTHVFTCEDWARDARYGALHFCGTREVVGKAIVHTSPAYEIAQVRG